MKPNSTVQCAARWVAALVSGILLNFAFAPYNQSELAWFALVPLLIAVRGAPRRQAFRLGLASGLAFWFVSTAWLWRLIQNGGPLILVVLGHLGLSLYCALYTALFCMIVACLWSTSPCCGRGGTRPSIAATPEDTGDSSAHADSPPVPDIPTPLQELGRALLATAAWVALEHIRAKFLTGFAWNHLGTSQASSPAILQPARLGGVFLISALVIHMNLALASVALRLWRNARGIEKARRNWDLMFALGLLMVAFIWGFRQMQDLERLQRTSKRLMVAAVQPNSPSIFERDDDPDNPYFARLRDNTERVAAFNPDLIIWPETVLPGSVPHDREAMEMAFEMAHHTSTPLLAGAVEAEPRRGARPLIANASWLFDPENGVIGKYRKQHLVPFGEYIPLDRWFPALERLSPIGFSCTAGTNSVIMWVTAKADRRLRQSPDSATPHSVAFSPLICFEDTVAQLSRRAVGAGAELLVNQSNDAWFGGSSQGAQHHAQAILRAVENTIPLVRCSNRGVSAIIDATGRSTESADFFAMDVAVRDDDWPLTPYTRYGDWLFAWPCTLVTLLLLLWWKLHKPPKPVTILEDPPAHATEKPEV